MQDQDFEAVRSALDRLRQDAEAGANVTRSETARLRAVFENVEATLKAGVSRNTVLTTLREHGFSMTAASFKSALQRIRKEREG